MSGYYSLPLFCSVISYCIMLIQMSIMWSVLIIVTNLLNLTTNFIAQYKSMFQKRLCQRGRFARCTSEQTPAM